MNQYAAILLSRQSLRPTGRTAWVRRSVEVVQWLRQRRYGLASSVGMRTWELLTALGSLERVRLRLYVPMESGDRFAQLCGHLTFEFALDPDLVEFIPVTLTGEMTGKGSLMAMRDRLVIEQADLLVPVALRDSGSMAAFLSEAVQSRRGRITRFQIQYDSRQERLAIDLAAQTLNPELLEIDHEYITHWTRATNVAWPKERLVDFYRAIIRSCTWPRSGFETLNRIVDGKKISASSEKMPGRIAAVCFSALPPRDVVELMKWRARYRRMSFEPYGVGIRKEIARQVGILPVRYFKRGEGVEIIPSEKWLWQSIGEVTDWTAEREYRHKGDLSLAAFPVEAVTLFCMTAEEAMKLRERYPFNVVSFLS